MIQRYLGNKNSIADYIISEIDRFCVPGDIVCDIFSGTVSMSMALKKHGYRVISNDISYFSYHFANFYLKNNCIPDFDLKALGIDKVNDTEVENQIEEQRGKDGFLFLDKVSNEDKFKKIAIILRSIVR